MTKPLWNLGLVALLPIMMTVSIQSVHSQGQADSPVPVARTVGLLDSDGSALYSVLFESADDSLSNLTVTSSLPPNTIFVEAVSAPDGTLITNAPDGKSISWQITGLDANTILGPFTYRVKAADPSVTLPAGVSANVSWTMPGAGSVTATPADGTLQPLDTSGQISADSKGTIDAQGQPEMIPIGHTGIWAYIPAGALPQAVTLTVTREAITATGSADLDKQFWWCADVSLTSTPAVTLAHPIQLSLTTRQVLTPNMDTQPFTQNSDSTWQVANGILSSTILPDGNHIIVTFGGNLSALPSPTSSASITKALYVPGRLSQTNKPVQLRVGVKQDTRKKATGKAPAISQTPAKTTTATGQPTPATKRTPQFLDVTATNTCYLETHDNGSTWTHCTVNMNGVYSGDVLYPAITSS